MSFRLNSDARWRYRIVVLSDLWPIPFIAGLMPKPHALISASLFLASALARAESPAPGGSETVVIHNGPIALHALVFRPQGSGPFPAILLNHGSGRTAEDLKRLGPYKGNPEKLGPLFAHHGYVFLYPFRRGVGPSTDQASSCPLRPGDSGPLPGPPPRKPSFVLPWTETEPGAHQFG